MDRRLQIDKEFREILQEVCNQPPENENVYFQPPESVKMKYDCIRYAENTMDVKRADDKAYLIRPEYTVTVITRDPDSILPKTIVEHFPYCRPGRKYVADNLYHYPFTIY